MPENAYRRGHLWSHLASSAQGSPSYALARIRHLHPDWPACSARCGWPVDPAAVPGGHTTHPTCEQRLHEETANT